MGFLREPERINVLLSRARHGLILIGNATTLRNANSADARLHWGRILDLLDRGKHMYKGLPAQCQRHKQMVHPLLSNPGDFKDRAPDGGCTLPCGEVLPCGHSCPLFCHAYDLEHVSVRCTEVIHDFCGKGHLVVRACSDQTKACSTCSELARLKQNAKARRKEYEEEQASTHPLFPECVNALKLRESGMLEVYSHVSLVVNQSQWLYSVHPRTCTNWPGEHSNVQHDRLGK